MGRAVSFTGRGRDDPFRTLLLSLPCNNIASLLVPWPIQHWLWSHKIKNLHLVCHTDSHIAKKVCQSLETCSVVVGVKLRIKAVSSTMKWIVKICPTGHPFWLNIGPHSKMKSNSGESVMLCRILPKLKFSWCTFPVPGISLSAILRRFVIEPQSSTSALPFRQNTTSVNRALAPYHHSIMNQVHYLILKLDFSWHHDWCCSEEGISCQMKGVSSIETRNHKSKLPESKRDCVPIS